MSLFSVVRHKLCERHSGKDSFKRFSVPNDSQYGSAGIDLSLSHTGDEGVEGAVDKTVGYSAQVLVSDDYTSGVRQVLRVRVVAY